MGIIKTGIQAGAAYAIANKVAKTYERSSANKHQSQQQQQQVPPHPPCNCPHCPFSQASIYGNAPMPPAPYGGSSSRGDVKGTPSSYPSNNDYYLPMEGYVAPPPPPRYDNPRNFAPAGEKVSNRKSQEAGW